MIVISDIHGRTFWEKAIKGNEDEEIIFLGDYLDPYGYEGISFNDAFSNFEKIIEFKKAHKDNVILLLGNHDCHYLEYISPCSRYDYINASKICKILKDNLDLFQLAYEKKINGKNYIFSHAGILSGWVKNNPLIFKGCNSSNIVSKINSLFSKGDIDLMIGLEDINTFRGGNSHYGSIIWADVREFLDEKKSFPNTYQIFGHTQQSSDPIIEDNYACLDCRKAFSIDDKGNIKALNSIDEAKVRRMIYRAIDDEFSAAYEKIMNEKNDK